MAFWSPSSLITITQSKYNYIKFSLFVMQYSNNTIGLGALEIIRILLVIKKYNLVSTSIGYGNFTFAKYFLGFLMHQMVACNVGIKCL